MDPRKNKQRAVDSFLNVQKKEKTVQPRLGFNNGPTNEVKKQLIDFRNLPDTTKNTPAQASAIQPRPVIKTGDQPETPKKKLELPKLSKKQYALLGIGAMILIAVGGFFVLKPGHSNIPVITKSNPEPTPSPTPSKEPEPTTVASTLSGLQVDPATNNKPVTAVMIENSPDARPQSGLLQASIVYEAIAEGGITRFLTLFQDQNADRIGPVRSLRPYYIDWLTPYDAGVAHVGGSQDALALVRNGSYIDMDEFFNEATYKRITERFAPHNVYTSLDNLVALAKTKGHTASTFTGFSRKSDAPSATPTATSIDFKISSYLYNVHYDYDKATNSYLRSEGGKTHTDEKSNKQLSPKVVIAMAVPNRAIESSDGWRMEYDTVGSGSAIIYQDGTSTPATWKKAGRKDPLQLVDANGKTIELNAGQTWITALGSISEATSK